MELKKAVEERRSIRKYLDREVSENLVLSILKEATHAPSAHNCQPWKFKILTTEEKNKISDTLYQKYKDNKESTASNTALIIKEAPMLVVVYLDNDNMNSRDMDLLSIGSIIDEVLLLSYEAGLGTLWIGNTNLISDDIRKITKVDLESVSTIAFGYPNQHPHKRPRKEFNDIIIKNKNI